MKYLITGGAGFIGSHLIEKLLSEKHKVLCIVAVGSVVTKGILAYSVFGGILTKKFNYRFNDDDLRKHKNLINREQYV